MKKNAVVFLRENGKWAWNIWLTHGKMVNYITDNGSYGSLREAKKELRTWAKEAGIKLGDIEEKTTRANSKPFTDASLVKTVYCRFEQNGFSIVRFPDCDFEDAVTAISPISHVFMSNGYSLWDRIKTAFKLIFTGRLGLDFSVELYDHQVEEFIDHLNHLLGKPKK